MASSLASSSRCRASTALMMSLSSAVRWLRSGSGMAGAEAGGCGPPRGPTEANIFPATSTTTSLHSRLLSLLLLPSPPSFRLGRDHGSKTRWRSPRITTWPMDGAAVGAADPEFPWRFAGGTQVGVNCGECGLSASVPVAVFSLFSLLLLRCLLPPPPPSAHPPARLSPPPPPFYGEPISPAVSRDAGARERGPRFRPCGQAEGRRGPRRQMSDRRARQTPLAAGRGGNFLFSSSAAAAADADAAVRETEQSMGPQPLKRAHFAHRGSEQPSFENGGSSQRQDARSRQSVEHTQEIRGSSRMH